MEFQRNLPTSPFKNMVFFLTSVTFAEDTTTPLVTQCHLHTYFLYPDIRFCYSSFEMIFSLLL